MNGWTGEGTTIIEASSGSTAVSEGYIARLLGLPFIAVMPHGTSQEKVEQIEFYGGQCRMVEAGDIYSESQRLVEELGGHRRHLGHHRSLHPLPEAPHEAVRGRPRQFGFLRLLPQPEPRPDHRRQIQHRGDRAARVEPSFIPELVDGMIKVPDAASFAAMHLLGRVLNRKCGPSTGTNLYAALQIAEEPEQSGEPHSIVSLIRGSGDRYLKTCCDCAWPEERGFDLRPYTEELEPLIRG